MPNNHFDQRFTYFDDLANAGYAIGLHCRFASAHVFVQTYPEAWIDIYTRNALMLSDPTVIWGVKQTGMRRWSEIDVPDPNRVFARAANYGLIYGVALSWGPMSSRSLASFARSDREFTDAEMNGIQSLFHLLHDEYDPNITLSPPQIEALRIVAKGHRYAEAAQMLGISESALKARLRSARENLRCKTTAAAIQRASAAKML